MKILKNAQIKMISAGAKGVYYGDGDFYDLDCPLVSQSCLDRFLLCTKEALSEYETYNCMKLVAIDYSVSELMKAGDCFAEQVVNG